MNRPIVVVLWACLCAVGAAGQASERVEYPVVLGWHQVVPDEAEIKRENGPVVHTADFETLLIRLRDNGIRTLTMDEYCEAVRQPEPPRDAVLLTADDGYESVHSHLLPLLQKYDMHLTSFVITDNGSPFKLINQLNSRASKSDPIPLSAWPVKTTREPASMALAGEIEKSAPMGGSVTSGGVSWKVTESSTDCSGNCSSETVNLTSALALSSSNFPTTRDVPAPVCDASEPCPETSQEKTGELKFCGRPIN